MESSSYTYSDKSDKSDKSYQINIRLIHHNISIVSFEKRNDVCIIQINNNVVEITDKFNNIYSGSIDPYTLYYLIKKNIEQNIMKINEKNNKYYITIIQKGYFDQEEDMEYIVEI